jgi:gamma-glutamyltranspeptidase/glutathione hydrolase
MVPLLEALYRQHGHLPWSSLFQTAIDRAAEGFSVSAALARAVSADATHLARLPATKTYFLAHGPIRQGAILKNPDYADMLRRIATEGSAGLTHGQAAADIAAAIRADATRGLMTTDDLAAYNATTHAAVCAPYAHATLCTAPGGVPVLQALGMLAHVDMPQQNPGTALLLLDAGYLAAIDAATQNPLAPGFIDSRAAMLHAGRAVPRTAQTSAQPDQADSAVVIVDAKGNAISFVSSIGTAFGSHIMTHGFLLNDTLAEFSAAGPNGMEPGKRPASLMAPVIARDAAGHVATVLATASGIRMPALAVQTLLALLTWQLDPAQALALPHIIGTASTNELETSHDTATLAAVLRARGETVVIGKVNSASALIRIGPKGLSAAADPRHDGAALGD